MGASILSDQPLRPLSALDPRTAKVDDLVDLLVPWFERLQAGDGIPDAEIPTDDEVAQWTRSLFTDHGGRLRMRRSTPKDATNVERAVHGLVRWHKGSGNLEGLFAAQWRAGREAWPRVETYVDVLLVAGGYRSRALAAWARTGLVPDPEEV